ncbi:MAG: putative tail sheath protein [Prokaryotic dsDNA virus sp.]|nr:MAG: putative tail sheath protein [Prokaryotic dsDNA virus sp.]|tara:strand:+ start:16930 stop:19860 length:2931 start_codon:yes stop_codon:yes gene_type:complete
MSIDKFRFVSPGVQVAEIDQSRRARDAADPGPVIIGRFERGPTMQPTKVDSLNELEEIFGRTITGRESGDISRNGNFSAPSYAAFAVNAWLANNGGATIMRLVGKQSSNAEVGSGEAGWTRSTTGSAGSGRGGAWGLWVIPSASTFQGLTGTLGAVFYCAADTGIVLSGTHLVTGGSTKNGQAAASLMRFDDGNIRAKVIKGISDQTSSVGGSEDEDVLFNFNPASRQFIRKVFNTTPHNTNSDVVASSHANYKTYWLGESFEDRVAQLDSQTDGTSALLCFTAPLVSGTVNYADHAYDAQPSKTGWVISQDVSLDSGSYSPANMQKLFRFVSLEEGEWTQRNLKISIRNIRLPNAASDADAYGSFDVQLRAIQDTDAAPEAVETYTNVNLNPASPNYIGVRIGDQRAVWNDAEKRYRYFGAYPNMSKYIRVEIASEVDEGAITQELVPFGFYGIPRPPIVTLEGSGSAGTGDQAFIQDAISSAFTVDGVNVESVNCFVNVSGTAGSGAKAITASLEWPTHKLVGSASLASLADPTDRYFGVDFTRYNSDTLFDPSVYDLSRARVSNLSSDSWDKSGNMVDSFIFSLDDVSGSANNAANGFVYVSGSRAATDGSSSWTAVSGTEAILDAGYDKFTMPLYGGFDGLDATQMEPLINNGLINGKTTTNCYEKYTLIRAIDTVADAELVDMNLLALPGITDHGVTDHMINTCERRRDAMALVDIKFAYTPRHESNEPSEAVRNAATGNNKVSTAVTTVKQKGYNSSYAACYYPWVQVSAPVTGLPTWVPPSVVALGAMSYSEATQAVWFAPAGFTRGGLSEGRGGLPVLAVSQRLSSKERDSLYEVNINPIAQFPAEGIVIFGQKTLQATPSALDRINVRRLLIFIKKRISRIASTLLFDPNVSQTWNRFISEVAPFLDGVKSGFGLDDFKIVLDSSTTTADLIDRNTMYAKIFVKPTKAIEFIAIDFIITNSGASFDD